MREDGWTDIGECKWGKVSSWPQLRAELNRKVSAFPNKRGATIGCRLFVRHLPAKRPYLEPGVRLHDLEDMYR